MSSKRERRRKEEQANLEWVGECVERALVRAGELTATAGDVGTYRALSDNAERSREHLQHIEEPLFGRLDFVEHDDVMPATVYIGKQRIRGRSASEDAVWDWRSPLGKAYMQATRDNPMNVGRRSSVTNANWQVSKVSDELVTRGFVAPSAELVDIPLPPGVTPDQWIVDLTGDPATVSAAVSETDEGSSAPAPEAAAMPPQVEPAKDELAAVPGDGGANDLSEAPDDYLTAELAELGETIRGEGALYDELVCATGPAACPKSSRRFSWTRTASCGPTRSRRWRSRAVRAPARRSSRCTVRRG
ncbi:MAG: hypothetical protein R2689_01655 [Microthrixaceae bacterium]